VIDGIRYPDCDETQVGPRCLAFASSPRHIARIRLVVAGFSVTHTKWQLIFVPARAFYFSTDTRPPVPTIIGHKLRHVWIWRTPYAPPAIPRPATMGGSSSALLATAHSLVVLAAHAQTLDSVPLDLSRQLVDLRELYSWRSLALYGHNVSVGV
jgi:hypothetical protein